MTEADREKSFGQYAKPNVVDRAGIFLSHVRMRRSVGGFRGKSILDAGCGYHAMVVRDLLGEVRQATLIDVAISDELKARPNVRAIESVLPQALEQVDSGTIDVVICNNVLEHLWKPEVAVAHFRRVLTPGGMALINVPSWRGKTVLEFASFRLHVVPEIEIDDHKRYYSTHELWSLLVEGGFKPSEVKRCITHKLGLNTYAECRVV
jgi:2-polyprenyl-3-methyl-5-hydroxy-6-metoxy-1,4-benzoquinol methylase